MVERAKPLMRVTYPTAKLLLVFGLFGGVLGGVIFALSMIVYTLAVGKPGRIATLPVVLMDFAMLGAMFGTLPALLCALWLRLWRVRRNALGLLHAGVAGGLVSMAALPVIYKLLALDGKIAGALFIFMAITGGLSAVILASWALPSRTR